MDIPINDIFIGVPCIDRRIDCETAIGVFNCNRLYGAEHYFHMGISEVSLARNIVTQKFLKSDKNWFVLWDSDIIASNNDFTLLWDSPDDISTAPYARKIPGKPPAMFGLGFTRVHRRVFEKINELQNEDGTEIAARFYMDGEIHTHFYPNGVTGDSRWLGEDRAFFTLCAMTGISYRLERRCCLQHAGVFLYGYPYQDNGHRFWHPDEDPVPDDHRPVQVM
jgi:hypothetical protein